MKIMYLGLGIMWVQMGSISNVQQTTLFSLLKKNMKSGGVKTQELLNFKDNSTLPMSLSQSLLGTEEAHPAQL